MASCSFLNPKEQELKQKVQDYKRSCFIPFYFLEEKVVSSYSAQRRKNQLVMVSRGVGWSPHREQGIVKGHKCCVFTGVTWEFY